MFCLFVFGCQYQCNRLPPELKVRNYMLRVEWGVKPYSLTHLLCLLIKVVCTFQTIKFVIWLNWQTVYKTF